MSGSKASTATYTPGRPCRVERAYSSFSTAHAKGRAEAAISNDTMAQLKTVAMCLLIFFMTSFSAKNYFVLSRDNPTQRSPCVISFIG
jgi:hypothetical protein